MRFVTLLCLFVVCNAADPLNARVIADLDALTAATKAGAKRGDLDQAIDRLARDLPNSLETNAALAQETWSEFARRMPELLERIEPGRRVRLLRQAAYCAPESLRAVIQTWRSAALAGVIALVETELNQESLNQLNQAAELLPQPGNCPLYLLRQQGKWPSVCAEDYQAIFGPCANRVEKLVRAWQPIRHPSLGSACLKLLQRQPCSQATLRILLERCASVEGADEPLRCGIRALSYCLEAYPEGPVLVTKAAAWFKTDLPLSVEHLLPWRGDEHIGSALVPLLLSGGTSEFTRPTTRFDQRNPWMMVLPSADQRSAIVDRLISGLELGSTQADPEKLLTLSLALHISCFPEAYGGMLNAQRQSRLETVLNGQDDVLCLLSFHVLGHLAGEQGIDSAYAAALRLQRVHDLLLPVKTQDQQLRGATGLMSAMAGILQTSRMRLTLCRLPLSGDDRKRVWGWYHWRNNLRLPVFAWLARTAATGQHPLAGLSSHPEADFPREWPRWSVERPIASRPAPEWRENLGQGLIYLRDFPEWSEGPAVVDAALADAQECQRLLHMLVFEESGRPSLRRALQTHAGLRAFALTETRYLETEEAQQALRTGKGKMPAGHRMLSQIWGDILADVDRAGEVIAADIQPRQGITHACADLARWQPAHPALDALATYWRSEVAVQPCRAFQLWCLNVLRGKDPGPLPRSALHAYLLNLGEVSDDGMRVIMSNPLKFSKHLESLRTTCPSRLESIDQLADTLAALQAAADNAE